MTFRRMMILSLLAVMGLALVAPVAALATGPSAGDQQYVDPLGGKSGGSGSSGSGSASSGSGSSSSASSSSGSTSASSSSAGSNASTLTPTATTASSAVTTATGSSTAGTLPRTGFDAWLGAGLGLSLLGAGVVLRRRVIRV